jgi:hypothetical protein
MYCHKSNLGFRIGFNRYSDDFKTLDEAKQWVDETRRVCQIDCVKGKDLSWKSIAKLNSEAIEGGFPISDGHRPLFSNIPNGEIDHF